VYIHADGKVMEYEGSVDSDNMREVKIDSTNFQIKTKKGWETLTLDNFEELYPNTFKENEHRKSEIFEVVKKTAVKIMELINNKE